MKNFVDPAVGGAASWPQLWPAISAVAALAAESGTPPGCMGLRGFVPEVSALLRPPATLWQPFRLARSPNQEGWQTVAGGGASRHPRNTRWNVTHPGGVPEIGDEKTRIHWEILAARAIWSSSSLRLGAPPPQPYRTRGDQTPLKITSPAQSAAPPMRGIFPSQSPLAMTLP
jgi:hypothetical protein